MAARPRFKPELTNSDKAVEIVGWLLILVVLGFTATNYQSLPEIIPTHYNGAGVADGFGDKWMILISPLVAAVLFTGLTILNKFPHIFNYPTEITADNALIQYTNATRLIRFLKVIIVVIFGIIVYQTIRHANGQTEGFGVWFLPLTIGLFFIPIIYFLIKSFQKTK